MSRKRRYGRSFGLFKMLSLDEAGTDAEMHYFEDTYIDEISTGTNNPNFVRTTLFSLMNPDVINGWDKGGLAGHHCLNFIEANAIRYC